jgi:hypothetical protein
MKKFVYLSLALWALTVGSLVYMFNKGSTEVSSDNRLAVQLSPKEKDMVLGEMRTILAAVNGVLHGVAQNDLPATASAAKSAGMAMAVDATPGLMAKLPLDFKTMGMQLHKDFDALAADIDSKKLNQIQIIERLGTMTNSCLACHGNYRIEAVVTTSPTGI